MTAVLHAPEVLPMTPTRADTGNTQFFQLPHGQLAYDDQGSGPLIVALPGLGDLRQTYRLLTPLLVSAGYRVVTLDPRGQGESSAVWPDYSPAANGEDLSALLQHLDAGPAVLVANSYSGGAAVWAAARTPERVAAMVLIGAFVRDPHVSLPQRLMMWAALSGPWKVSGWLTYFATLFRGGTPADQTAYHRRLRDNLTEPGRFAALQAMLRATRAPVEAQLSAVRAPTLVLMGSRDPDFPDPGAEGQFIARALRGQLTLLEGAGHYPQAEQPQRTASAVLDFLREHR
ncbi:alpha/beta hydrolase [Deinococcus sp. KNUC1210]|uniref:alpha/beta fold hydrolase n=1 Tax=Deinococcus sp. KNUC1210 TaxID=2917691 RepID=UPI001EF13FED|nr:alpha/beta hydrolase [Deinococcus sp. KNUC1210]ULH16425.1 alpha/beta hydrolase [Deinococcus sp. KNUC1210]